MKDINIKYKIYTKRNLADTCRDKDNYIYKTICLKDQLDDAIKVANDYMKIRFSNKKVKLIELKGAKNNVIFTATDFCSYPETIVIKKSKYYHEL